MVRRRVCRPIVDLTASMSRLAGGDIAGEIPAAERKRRDRRDGGCRAGVQGQHDQGRSAGRRDRKPRTTSRCVARACSTTSPAPFESKVGELVGGLSSSSAQDGSYRAVDVLDRGGRPTARPASSPPPRQQTPTNVQTVASATEELTSSITEIGRQVAQSGRDRRPRGRERPPHRRYRAARSPPAPRRSATS